MPREKRRRADLSLGNRRDYAIAALYPVDAMLFIGIAEWTSGNLSLEGGQWGKGWRTAVIATRAQSSLPC